jgi:PKD repeat protein
MSPPIAWHPGDQPPAIQFNVSQTGALTYAASTAGSSGNVARSTIDFGDGTIVSTASAVHTYAAPGTYRITASVYDQAGASAVAVQQISAKSPSGGITIASPADGSTVNWPTMLVASANPGTPVAAMRVLIDGAQAYAAHSDTLHTALKVFTGTHNITVQSLDAAGNTTATASVNVLAEPDDLPPIANITLKPLTSVSPTTMLGCTATSTDPDGFIMSFHLQYSDGSLFTTPAAPRTFAAPGQYKATATVMDQFGSTSTTSTTFSVAGGPSPANKSPSPAPQHQQRPLQPVRPPS